LILFSNHLIDFLDGLSHVHQQELQMYGATSIPMGKDNNETCQGLCNKGILDDKQGNIS
jgi:hypothetical protein